MTFFQNKVQMNFILNQSFRLMAAFLFFPFLVVAQVEEVGPCSLKMNIEGNTLRIPYFAGTQIDSVNTTINKVVIVVHGMNRNAGDYYRNMKEAASMSAHYTDSVMIVAPQFLEEEDLDPNHLDATYLYWSSGWKSGSNSKNNSGHPRPARIPSYAAMDTLMLRLAQYHPNLKFIVVAGHSAGAQLVNRYSACSPLADMLFQKYGIKTRFIVANPSSYLYLDNKRAIPGSVNHFEVPNTTCSYNRWRYGLENLYTYPAQFGADSIRNMLRRRDVVYLLGELDTDETSSSLDQSCQAELQGKNRLERGTIYYNHLIDYYGTTITETQHRDTVPGVGHDNRGMFTSSVGRYWLFMNDPVGGPLAVLQKPGKNLKIFPNPVTDKLHVLFSGNFKPLFFSLLNTSGKIIVNHRMVTGNRLLLHVGNLKPGLYLLLLNDKNKTVTKPFLKE